MGISTLLTNKRKDGRLKLLTSLQLIVTLLKNRRTLEVWRMKIDSKTLFSKLNKLSNLEGVEAYGET